jgi:hypothetical protein
MTTSAPPSSNVSKSMPAWRSSAFQMLLHTNEGVGPHTQTTVHYIAELKKKHGIDYDSHASYRFVEA